MATNDNSVLNDTKKVLGIDPDVTVFDTDIIMHINSAFATLSQLGLGPDGGFEIEDDAADWTGFLLTDLQLAPVKTYIHLRVKLLFDPPPTSWVVVAYKEQIEQLEWRLNMLREDKIPFVETPLPDEDDYFLLDGGVI